MKIIIRTPVTYRLMLAFAMLSHAVNVNAQAPTHSPVTNTSIDENINGYWEYLPRDYTPAGTERYPLIIFLHGAGEQGTDLQKLLAAGPPKIIQAGLFPESLSVNGKTYKYIVLSPQIINGIVGNTSIITPQTISRFISHAKSTYSVDPARVYLLGLSMGGGAVWDYIGSSAEASEQVAAIAVACGAGDLSTREASFIAASNLKVLAGHNVHDNIISVSRTENNVDSILIAEPSVESSPLAFYWPVPLPGNGTHNVWSRMFEKIEPASVEGGNLTDSLSRNIYEWLLEYSRPAMSLPVVWESFSARVLAEKVELVWRVSAQQNVDDYSVERSQDGVNWQILHSIDASGNTIEPTVYRYIDPQPFNATNLYRIREKDIDGTLNYSAIEKVIFSSVQLNKIRIFPNPFSTELNLDLPAIHPDKLFIEMYDLTGKLVWQKSQNVQNSQTRLTLESLPYLKPGYYQLHVKDILGNSLYAGQVLKK